MKKAIKWALVVLAGAFGLGFGNTASAAVNAHIPATATWATPNFRKYLSLSVTFIGGLVLAILATVLTGKVKWLGKAGGIATK